MARSGNSKTPQLGTPLTASEAAGRLNTRILECGTPDPDSLNNQQAVNLTVNSRWGPDRAGVPAGDRRPMAGGARGLPAAYLEINRDSIWNVPQGKAW